MTRQRAFKVDDLPEFEGRPVVSAVWQMVGPWPLDFVADKLLGIGEVVDVVVTLQCVAVRHSVRNSRGEIVRVHQLRPTTVTTALPSDRRVDDDTRGATALELVPTPRSRDESTRAHGR